MQNIKVTKFFFGFILIISCLLIKLESNAQVFYRSELPTQLTTPWEIIYDNFGYLWVTEAGGQVSRISLQTGIKKVAYIAPDYYGGSPTENSPNCPNFTIGRGTLGMAFDPEYGVQAGDIYLMYSYNAGTAQTPSTKFKVVKLKWHMVDEVVTSVTDVVLNLPNGYDHLGGRLLTAMRGGVKYLYVTIGDHGLSEDNSPGCYTPAESNPNNFAQDPATGNGKIHRFLLDGSIPADNPIPGNSMYTRGHRNPQGLAYNKDKDILYGIEHGDRTDDEVNVLVGGKNYGWKDVRGYLNDNNYPGEQAYVQNYVPNSQIAGDELKGPLYSWCDVPQPTNGNYLDWCTVAPSDGIYFNSEFIPEWTNSLLVTTLKNGTNTDAGVYQLKLNSAGDQLASAPVQWFAGDQQLNGRLRDICYSPDGRYIYLINNGGTDRDKITVYMYSPTGVDETTNLINSFQLFPNPSTGVVSWDSKLRFTKIRIVNSLGQESECHSESNSLNLGHLTAGVYSIKFELENGRQLAKRWIKL